MQIQNDISLKEFNTFGIDVKAKEYISISSNEQLKNLLETRKEVFVLSGGSNVLLTKSPDKLVVHLNTKGKKIEQLDNGNVLVTVQAGENWHEFVLWCIDKGFGGLENLSLIPGNVGTCPIQNIGAYGSEVKDTITKVSTIEIATEKIVEFSNEACCFGYRNSIFKQDAKGKYIITAVSFELTKSNHQLNYSYGAIQSQLNERSINNPTIKDISDVVIAIRNSKLPNPKEIGNCGSFFKNPVVPKSLFEEIKKNHPNIPHYEVSETEIKIPAGWLIENAGFKGKRYGNTGAHKNQALVLVNYGEATGNEVVAMATKIQKEIAVRFGISLEVEVNIL
ncbi:MAG: UDP-N-acetylmuramate dehydrogenase [Flavicella sp.]